MTRRKPAELSAEVGCLTKLAGLSVFVATLASANPTASLAQSATQAPSVDPAFAVPMTKVLAISSFR